VKGGERMRTETEYNGYLIKVHTWGDSTTTIYRYTLCKPRKWWFSKLLWVEDIHKDRMPSKISDKFDWVIKQYKNEMERWEM
jgi:hypothetical protein